MTLPAKRARSITVDGARYRWIVSDADAPALKVFIQAAHGHGPKLEVWADEVVTPAAVAACVRAAVAGGWAPDVPGPALVGGLYGRAWGLAVLDVEQSVAGRRARGRARTRRR
jgi:hypothetical protein